MKKKIIFLIAIIILILFLSPWMFDDGGENMIRKVQMTDDYDRVMEKITRDHFCDGVHSQWAPFGRMVKYCDRAEWYVTFWGKIIKWKVVK